HRLSLTWSAPWLAPGAVWYQSRVSPLQRDFGPASRTPGIEVENLGPGRYRVEVEARLEGEPTWSQPLRLEVEVAPRAWETWWARGALLMLAVLAAFGAVRLRTRHLRRRAEELQAAVERELADTKVLRGLLPICSSCKKVRDDSGYWSQIESYIREHSEAEFSHGLCPGCMKELYPDFAAKQRPRE
ncbi:MAG TPA: hypothetical protein VJU18_07340, partial [Vicinamibacteria bacterium]|nr:hypothetical protein [Vicinamibacteria bacterium]